MDSTWTGAALTMASSLLLIQACWQRVTIKVQAAANSLPCLSLHCIAIFELFLFCSLVLLDTHVKYQLQLHNDHMAGIKNQDDYCLPFFFCIFLT
jgi:hypothetical protein